MAISSIKGPIINRTIRTEPIVCNAMPINIARWPAYSDHSCADSLRKIDLFITGTIKAMQTGSSQPQTIEIYIPENVKTTFHLPLTDGFNEARVTTTWAKGKLRIERGAKSLSFTDCRGTNRSFQWKNSGFLELKTNQEIIWAGASNLIDKFIDETTKMIRAKTSVPPGEIIVINPERQKREIGLPLANDKTQQFELDFAAGNVKVKRGENWLSFTDSRGEWWVFEWLAGGFVQKIG